MFLAELVLLSTAVYFSRSFVEIFTLASFLLTSHALRMMRNAIETRDTEEAERAVNLSTIPAIVYVAYLAFRCRSE